MSEPGPVTPLIIQEIFRVCSHGRLQISPVTGWLPSSPPSDCVVTGGDTTLSYSPARHFARPIVNTGIALSCLTSSPLLLLAFVWLRFLSFYFLFVRLRLVYAGPPHVQVIKVTTDLSSCTTINRIKIQFGFSARAYIFYQYCFKAKVKNFQ